MLETKVGYLRLKTPILLASGYITETPNFFLKAEPFGCSGMITRSLKEIVPPERARVPAPRYVVFDDDSMLNCEWGNEYPWSTWADTGVEEVKRTGSAIIVSLSGRDIDGCCRLMKTFNDLDVDAFEINVSCSHSGALHGNLNIDVVHMEELLDRVRKVTRIPIWIKLSYSHQLVSMARRAEDLGADAIVCTNSIGPGLMIDTATARPKLGIMGGAGGMTGKAIFPIALNCVYQLAKNLHIPIVGCGGIFTADDVIQMLMAGASAVQLYTAPALKGPEMVENIAKGLRCFLCENPQYVTIEDIIGLAQNTADVHRFDAPKPIITEERCQGCGLCEKACAFGAITMQSGANGRRHAVIGESCNSCNACVGVCPKQNGAVSTIY